MSNTTNTMTEGISVPTVNQLHEPELECSLLPDYPGLLFYSDGRVFRIKTGQFLTGNCSCGYRRLGINGKPFVHRLIARAFLPNPKNLPVVNHKNCDRSDNRVENLEWCTVKYNNQTLNKRYRFGYIYQSYRIQEKEKPFFARYNANGKEVKDWFATRVEAQAWLDAAEEVARANLRPDM